MACTGPPLCLSLLYKCSLRVKFIVLIDEENVECLIKLRERKPKLEYL